MRNVSIKKIIFFVIFSWFAQPMFACELNRWDVISAEAKNVLSGGIRLEGLCSLKVDSGQYAKQSVSFPTNTYLRFYLYQDSTQNVEIPILSLSTNSGDIEMSIDAANQLRFVGINALLPIKKWNSIEININKGVASLWINNKLVKNNVSTINASINQMRLGDLSVPSALQGLLYIDAFAVSNQKIGNSGVSTGLNTPLIPGDANGDGTVVTADAVAIFNEVGRPNPKNTGVPDCNLDGKINTLDVVCSLRKR